jgi:hypothetical protein
MKQVLKALLGLNAASLLHLAKGDAQRALRSATRAFTAAKNCPSTSIPEISLGDILGSCQAEVRLCVRRYEDGMLPSEQALALLSILVAEAPREVLEIGTFMGHTTRYMAENLPEATIHTVDLPPDFSPAADPNVGIPKDDFHLITTRKVGREFSNLPCAARIKQHFADTAVWDFREAGYPTFFFIDGSHTYEYCKNDSEKCFELCGGRGVFLWHDCDENHSGVLRCLSEWRRRGRDVRRIAGTPIGYWKGA